MLVRVCLSQAMVSRDEAERFARSKGGYFPKPQVHHIFVSCIGMYTLVFSCHKLLLR